jgi:hypothetical protein
MALSRLSLASTSARGAVALWRNWPKADPKGITEWLRAFEGPEATNGRTKTWGRSSVETYATQRMSGENAPMASSDSVLRSETGCNGYPAIRGSD